MEWLAAVPPVAVALVVFFVVMAESLGLPLPGETILIGAILVTLAGHGSTWVIAGAAALGAIGGDSIGYLLGKRYGRRAFELGATRFPSVFGPRRVGAAIALMERYGAVAVFFGRFVAILRIFAGPLAGTLRMSYRRFLIANVLGALVWSFGITALITWLGAIAEHYIHAATWVALILVGVGVITFVIVLLYRSRREPANGAGPDASERELSFDDLFGLRETYEPRPGATIAQSALDVLSRLYDRTLGRAPFAWCFSLIYMIIGLITGSAWSSLRHRPWYTDVAFGLPAFQNGRWWTIFTGTPLAENPLFFGTTLALSILALGWMERRRGTLTTAIYFVVGQVVAIVGTATFLAIFSATDWPWANELAKSLDVGPSGGLFVCLIAAVATASSPWRLRWRLGIAVYLIVSVLFFGSIAELEHAVVGIPALFLFFGLRPSRPSVREWRTIAFTSLIAIGLIQLVVAALPTFGPFGRTTPNAGDAVDVLFDAVVIAFVAGGIRAGRRVAWWVAIILAGLNILAGSIVILTFVFGFVPITALRDAGVTLTGAVLWLLLFVVLASGRTAFRVPFRRRRRNVAEAGTSEQERSLRLLHRYGGNTLSWMSTWPEMRYFFSADDQSVIPCQRHGGVIIGLGDPIGPADSLADTIAQFTTRADAVDVIPCFFSASQPTFDAMPQGWRHIVIAEDTLIDLPDFTLTGKKWQSVRTAVNRAERDGIRFELVALADQPWAIRAQVRAISEMWVGDKGLPEMRFTLGGVDEAMDRSVRVALALDADNSVHGVLSWLPVFGADNTIRGWTLDLMRRREDAFGPVIEFLIAESALSFKDESAAFLSLSAAPLVTEHETSDSGVQHLLEYLGRALEPVYGFQSLHSFKAKFNPRFEPLYLLYRDEAELPRIGQALVRAFLPDSNPIELARAGLQLTRR